MSQREVKNGLEYTTHPQISLNKGRFSAPKQTNKYGGSCHKWEDVSRLSVSSGYPNPTLISAFDPQEGAALLCVFSIITCPQYLDDTQSRGELCFLCPSYIISSVQGSLPGSRHPGSWVSLLVLMQQTLTAVLKLKVIIFTHMSLSQLHRGNSCGTGR